MSSFKSRVSCTFSSCFFKSKNNISWYSLFLYLLYNLRGCSFEFVVSKFYHGDRKLIFHVRCKLEIFYLVFYDLGIFQVQLDVLSLEKLVLPLFDVIFSLSNSFLQSSRLRCNSFLLYFGRKSNGLICFYFRLKLVNNVLSFRKVLLRIYILLVL